jgi:superfamily II DNA or RNA helicase
LKNSKIEFEDSVLSLLPCPDLAAAYEASGKKLKLRDYQAEALVSWGVNDKWGVIVLPTGSGKILVGIQAIAGCNIPTLVIVPTLDLLEQWKKQLEESFSMKIGQLGGGEKKFFLLQFRRMTLLIFKPRILGTSLALLFLMKYII